MFSFYLVSVRAICDLFVKESRQPRQRGPALYESFVSKCTGLSVMPQSYHNLLLSEEMVQ